MSDLFETVKGGQDIFKKLLSYIPGFSGYIERTNRRAADKLLREQVALMLEKNRNLTVDDVRAIFANIANDRPGTGPTPADAV